MNLISRWALIAATAVAGTGCSHDGRPPALGESISVEQSGGAATQLISSGTQLPVAATESFTTARDGEKKLYVHVLRGAAKKAGKLASDSWWSIDGVPEGKAGEPRIFVTFELDAKADLTLSARQESFKLKAVRLEHAPEGAKPAPLTEPDDGDDGPDEEGE
jgi:molecular chaperone DnaK (HSP70)